MSTKKDETKVTSNIGGERNLTSSGRLSTKAFLYQLITKEADVEKDYDAVLVKGLKSVGHLIIQLKKGDEVVRSTKPKKLEGAEDTSTTGKKGEGIRHFLFQLMKHRRSEAYDLNYDAFLITNLSSGKDYKISVLDDEGKELKTLSLPKDFGDDSGEGINYRKNPDFSQDPWE